MTIKELRETRRKSAQTIRRLADLAQKEKRDFTETEQLEWDAANEQYDELSAKINIAETGLRSNQITAEAESLTSDFKGADRVCRNPDDPPRNVPVCPETKGDVFRDERNGKEIRGILAGETLESQVRADEHSQYGTYPDLDVGRYLRGVATGNWENAENERRAMGEGANPTGGIIVPTQLSCRILDLARGKCQCINAGAQTVNMDSDTLRIARVTKGPTVSVKGENKSIAESDLTLDAVILSAFTMTAMVRCSVELAEDGYGVSNLIKNELSAAFAEKLDCYALFGNGSGEPTGLFSTPNVNVISMGTNGAALIGYSQFNAAMEDVESNNGEAIAAIMSPRTYYALDALTATDNQPLQAPASYQTLGKYRTTQVSDAITHGNAENSSCVFLGDFRNMVFGMRTKLVIEASREASDAFDNLQVVIRGYMRADVAVLRPTQFATIAGIIPAA